MRRLTTILCALWAAIAIFAGETRAEKPVAPAPDKTRAISVEPAPTPNARRDYESAERVGTREGWLAFLAKHSTGFHAELARAQLDKISRAAPESAPQGSGAETGKTKVASVSRITVLPSPNANTPAEVPVAVSRLPEPDANEIKILPAPKSEPRVRPAVTKPQIKKEAVRPPEPSPRERARERAKVRAEKAREPSRERVRKEQRFTPVPKVARASCPAGSSPMPQPGRMCCETTPERGAPRIFCP